MKVKKASYKIETIGGQLYCRKILGKNKTGFCHLLSSTPKYTKIQLCIKKSQKNETIAKANRTLNLLIEMQIVRWIC